MSEETPSGTMADGVNVVDEVCDVRNGGLLDWLEREREDDEEEEEEADDEEDNEEEEEAEAEEEEEVEELGTIAGVKSEAETEEDVSSKYDLSVVEAKVLEKGVPSEQTAEQ